jgi:NAD/NADP transhydrogenase alpha subunit
MNVAVLKERAPDERRLGLVPSVTAGLFKLDAKLHMETEAGDASS